MPLDLGGLRVLRDGALGAHGQLGAGDRGAVGLDLQRVLGVVVAGVGEGELLVPHLSAGDALGHREGPHVAGVGVGHRHLGGLVLGDRHGLRIRGGQGVAALSRLGAVLGHGAG